MRIPLKNRKKEIVAYTVIDDADYDLVKNISWSRIITMGKYPYAFGNIKVRGKWKGIKLHRLLLKPKPNELVDHKNGDGLDNRRSNLRVCNKAQNGQNSKRPSNNTTGFKGIIFVKSRADCGTPCSERPWMAQIGHENKHITIGYFKTAKLAAQAYDKKAKELHGEFAKLNF